MRITRTLDRAQDHNSHGSRSARRFHVRSDRFAFFARSHAHAHSFARSSFARLVTRDPRSGSRTSFTLDRIVCDLSFGSASRSFALVHHSASRGSIWFSGSFILPRFGSSGLRASHRFWIAWFKRMDRSFSLGFSRFASRSPRVYRTSAPLLRIVCTWLLTLLDHSLFHWITHSRSDHLLHALVHTRLHAHSAAHSFMVCLDSLYLLHFVLPGSFARGSRFIFGFAHRVRFRAGSLSPRTRLYRSDLAFSDHLWIVLPRTRFALSFSWFSGLRFSWTPLDLDHGSSLSHHAHSLACTLSLLDARTRTRTPRGSWIVFAHWVTHGSRRGSRSDMDMVSGSFSSCSPRIVARI